MARGNQVLPTKQRQKELAHLLDDKARAGDTNACGWLLLLTEMKQKGVQCRPTR